MCPRVALQPITSSKHPPRTQVSVFVPAPEKHQFDNMLIRMTNMQKSPPEETPRLMTVDSVGDKKNAKGAGKII